MPRAVGDAVAGSLVRTSTGGILVVIRFPSMQATKGWYRSSEYREVPGLRPAAARFRLLFGGDRR
jgi:uncharacterized protein (DUF1330 family)